VCRTPVELGLLYGEDFPAWERSFLEALRAPRPGAVILRSPPRTGKTSFLRHVMGRLRGSHRFYVLLASDLELLTSPQTGDVLDRGGRMLPGHDESGR
jgi:hypothetical protein